MKKRKCTNLIGYFFIGVVLLYVLLLIPDKEDSTITSTNATPFYWKKDSVWLALENNYASLKKMDSATKALHLHKSFEKVSKSFSLFKNSTSTFNAALIDTLVFDFFSLSSAVAVNTFYTDSLLQLYSAIRNEIKDQSVGWDYNNPNVEKSLYTSLYGLRTAVEEVLLQSNEPNFNAILPGKWVASSTPFSNINGIQIHSGDILVSRGGAEVSALISRGNDFPGNFSHIALLHVDATTKAPQFIEAHIEKGVALATLEQYLSDTKLRFMVLRLRSNLNNLKRDSLLPHRAAMYALNKVSQRHIPYDFAMNYSDTSAMFCSEVASNAYAHFGINLWQNTSTLSSTGIQNWLQSFGVKNFTTQMPSDLEYDSQLSIVAEWYNTEKLFQDHLDNALMDVLLEKANSGLVIPHSIVKLPIARIIKGYSVLLNWFGREGIIPEGMSATQALRNQSFVQMFAELKLETNKRIAEFISLHNYRPPYWQLISLAKKASTQIHFE